jgi:hypothetical protein
MQGLKGVIIVATIAAAAIALRVASATTRRPCQPSP